MYKKITILTFLFQSLCVFAGNDPSLMGGRSISLGHAYTGVRGDLWAMSYNPAGIAQISGINVGFYTERRFMMKELTFGGAAFAMPFKDKHFVGMEIGSFGYSIYRENRVSATYATTFGEIVSLGVKANYSSTSLNEFGNSGAFFLDLGANTKVGKNMTLGLSAYNVNFAKIKTINGRQNLPTVITAGICYQPSDKVTIVADVQKNIQYPTSFRGGIEYKVASFLCARIGASTAPLIMNAGIGVNYKHFSFDFANSIHERLGYTPSFSFAYRFDKKTKG
jgi:hypothetical protein